MSTFDFQKAIDEIKEIEEYDRLKAEKEKIKEDSGIEIRIFDHNNSRVAYKNLTVGEYQRIEEILKEIHWELF